jgi:Fe2+ transport system protein FeoA
MTFTEEICDYACYMDTPQKKLSEIDEKFKEYQIAGYTGPALVIQRLKEFGFHLGTKVQWVSETPLAGPKVFQMNNTAVALRREEAECLFVS